MDKETLKRQLGKAMAKDINHHQSGAKTIYLDDLDKAIDEIYEAQGDDTGVSDMEQVRQNQAWEASGKTYTVETIDGKRKFETGKHK